MYSISYFQTFLSHLSHSYFSFASALSSVYFLSFIIMRPGCKITMDKEMTILHIINMRIDFFPLKNMCLVVVGYIVSNFPMMGILSD